MLSGVLQQLMQADQLRRSQQGILANGQQGVGAPMGLSPAAIMQPNQLAAMPGSQINQNGSFGPPPQAPAMPPQTLQPQLNVAPQVPAQTPFQQLPPPKAPNLPLSVAPGSVDAPASNAPQTYGSTNPIEAGSNSAVVEAQKRVQAVRDQYNDAIAQTGVDIQRLQDQIAASQKAASQIAPARVPSGQLSPLQFLLTGALGGIAAGADPYRAGGNVLMGAAQQAAQQQQSAQYQNAAQNVQFLRQQALQPAQTAEQQLQRLEALRQGIIAQQTAATQQAAEIESRGVPAIYRVQGQEVAAQGRDLAAQIRSGSAQNIAALRDITTLFNTNPQAAAAALQAQRNSSDPATARYFAGFDPETIRQIAANPSAFQQKEIGQANQANAVAALDKTKGQDILATQPSRIYVMDATGRLRDAQTATQGALQTLDKSRAAMLDATTKWMEPQVRAKIAMDFAHVRALNAMAGKADMWTALAPEAQDIANGKLFSDASDNIGNQIVALKAQQANYADQLQATTDPGQQKAIKAKMDSVASQIAQTADVFNAYKDDYDSLLKRIGPNMNKILASRQGGGLVAPAGGSLTWPSGSYSPPGGR